MDTKYAVICARAYATQFNPNTIPIAIYHLSSTLEMPYQEAKELFYHYDIKEVEDES